MHTYLEQHIKDLMERHSALGPALSDAGIGCTTCSLGTCKVKDILEIHNLDTQQTQALLTRMGEIIHWGAPFEVPVLTRRATPTRSTFCPPIARMVAEHTHILGLIERIPVLIAALKQDLEGELFARCAEVETAFGERPKAYENFVASLNNI